MPDYDEGTQNRIERYKAAYAAANGEDVGKRLKVEYAHGWYKLRLKTKPDVWPERDVWTKSVRREELDQMCDALERRAENEQRLRSGLSMNEYQALAMRTAMKTDGEKPAPEYLALSLTGEAGEIAEIIKKHFYHGHPMEVDALADELGDLMWYIAVMANVYGFDLGEIARRNVEKLRRRYPEGFSKERSRNREERPIADLGPKERAEFYEELEF